MPKGKTDKVKDRLVLIEDMLLEHYTDAMVVRACTKQFGVSARTVKDNIREVRERWTAESEEARPHKKAAAANRLMRLARKLSERPAEVLKVEKLLSEIEGTKAPLQVEQDTSLELDSRGLDALNAFAQALGVPLEDVLPDS